MFEPVKVAFGQYMGRFFASIRPTTQSMPEFISRPMQEAIMLAPGRMVDSAEDMLAEFRKNATVDTETVTQGYGKLPIIIVAFAKDYTPTDGIKAFPPEMVVLPGDEKGRFFKLTTVSGEIRTQVAFIVHDEPTARSLAAQFLQFAKRSDNRAAAAEFCFAGMKQVFPLEIMGADAYASNIPVEEKNLTILTVDLTIRAAIPFFDAPLEGEANDGKGIVGTSDPPGYPVVLDTSNGVGQSA